MLKTEKGSKERGHVASALVLLEHTFVRWEGNQWRKSLHKIANGVLSMVLWLMSINLCYHGSTNVFICHSLLFPFVPLPFLLCNYTKMCNFAFPLYICSAFPLLWKRWEIICNVNVVLQTGFVTLGVFRTSSSTYVTAHWIGNDIWGN